ncbi:MAG: hypothetical protein ACJ74O_12525 [Frankiaceae bacterium]
MDREAPVEDVVEQEQTLGEAAVTESSPDPEAPEADVMEQRTPVGRSQYALEHRLPAEADAADAAEQAHVVDSDDEDYR